MKQKKRKNIGTKHTVTTADNRILHRKHLSKPISEFTQKPNNKWPGPRGPNGRFIKSPRMIDILDIDSNPGGALPPTPTTPTSNYGEATTTPKSSGTLGRGRSKLIRNRENSGSPGHSPTQLDQQLSITGPLTIVADNMTDAEVDRVIKDAREANTEIQIRDHNGKVIQSEYKSLNSSY